MAAASPPRIVRPEVRSREGAGRKPILRQGVLRSDAVTVGVPIFHPLGRWRVRQKTMEERERKRGAVGEDNSDFGGGGVRRARNRIGQA